MHVRNGMKERISQSMEEQLNEDVEERGKFFLPVRGRRYSLGQRTRAKTSKTGESGRREA